MNNLGNILSRYTTGSYSPLDLEHIETLLQNEALALSDIDDINMITEATAYEADSAAITRMDQNFYSLLNPPVDRNQKIFVNNWIIMISALALILTAICFYLLGKSSAENTIDYIESPQHFASKLLNSNQIEDRIHLVSNIAIQDPTTDDILDVLLYNIISDESTNVRLSSINSLRDYVSNPFVRQGLINAIPFQDSPIVLMYIKEAIKQSGQEMAKEDFLSRIPQATKSAFEKSLKTISI